MRPVTKIAAVGAALAGTMIAIQAPANANPKCGKWTGCSTVSNQSYGFVRAYHNWCGSKQIVYQASPPCGWNNPSTLLGPGKHTRMNTDWDTFEVPTNCAITYNMRVGPTWGFDHTIKRYGKVPAWVRVHNGEWAVITNSSCISR